MNTIMQKRLTDYAIPLILVILSLLGGGKLTFQFSILAIVVISIIGLILLSKNKLIMFSKDLVLPLLLMFLLTILNIFTSSCIYLTLKSTMQIIVYVLVFILTINVLNKAKVVATLAIISIVQVFAILFQVYTGETPFGLLPNNPNFVNGYLAAVFVFLASYAINHENELNKVNKILILTSLFLSLTGISFGRSRSVIIVFIPILFYLIYKRFKLKGAVGLSIVLLTVLSINTDKLIIKYGKTSDSLAYYRMDLWKSAVKMTADHPFLGVGLGNYGKIFPKYNFPVETETLRYSKTTNFAHNEFLQIAAEFGIPGLLLVLWLYTLYFKEIHKINYLLLPSIVIVFQSIFDMNLHLPINIFLILIFYSFALIDSSNKSIIKLGNSTKSIFLFSLMIIFTLYGLIITSEFCAFKKDYAKSILFNPLNADNYLKLSLSKELKNPEKVDLLKKAVTLDSENYIYHKELGYIYWHNAYNNRKLLKDAIQELNITLNMNPYSAITYYYLAKMFFDTNEYIRAIEYTMKALELEPNIIEAKYLLFELNKKVGEK
ncbi:MAG: hypothetical protein A2252_03260 [Elusimicrobia bacterium RIFOXYA2_FULL_39_19]|nr:MAG: hypothetical protein A2252_03260 [Elusimicrobia bacterium RIFOXYA2_FULL_39_19]